MQVPFTILTGFLGAGKTTVLNRMLGAPQGRRIAVLVNELGRVAIDSRLILSQGGDVLELAGGCVCCKIDVKNDLWDGIVDVIRRSQPDHVVLETTGIAEPQAILEGIARLPDEQAALMRVAGVVCVVDAASGVANLERRDEARAQIECAERLLLSKLDIAPAEVVRALHQRLDALGTSAERASFPLGEAGTRALVPWLLETRAIGKPASHHHSHRQGQLVAASFVDDAPLLLEPVLELLRRHRAQLVRAKGFLHVAGVDRRVILQLAGQTDTEVSYAEPWAGDPPRTELVLIGEDLDEAALRRQLWACRAAA